jgi:hypothetical protein
MNVPADIAMIPVLVMIILHSGAGVEIDLQTDSITNLRNPEPQISAFNDNVRCQVNMSDGKFVTTRETCAEVRRLMQDK